VRLSWYLADIGKSGLCAVGKKRADDTDWNDDQIPIDLFGESRKSELSKSPKT
jgi:hypothetical protein